ncbi:hypothetical protein D8Z77_13110 [Brevibacillus laterosporus]|nr:hypothetical protein D8Z77_13110 [Brevibacillus laterosporus]
MNFRGCNFLWLNLQQDQVQLSGDEKGNLGKKSVLLAMSHWRIESLIAGKYAFNLTIHIDGIRQLK